MLRMIVDAVCQEYSAWLGVLGVALGCWITYRTTRKNDRRKMLMDCYSEMLQLVLNCTYKQKVPDRAALFAAAQRTKLLCNREAGRAVDAVLAATLKETIDNDELMEAGRRLHDAARFDLRDACWPHRAVRWLRMKLKKSGAKRP